MTTSKHITTLDLPSLYRSSIGLDRIMDQMLNHANNGNYPPYNVIALNDDHYRIEVAVAGFGKEDISVTVQEGELIIAGRILNEDGNSETRVLHHGISSRAFERTFALAEYVEVTEATVENGILRIELERLVPEEKQPKQIEIK